MPGLSSLPVAAEESDSFKGSTLSLTLQTTSTVLLALIALVCIHELLYQLESILVPFVLSGFIVLAVEPSVTVAHMYLAGLTFPYRWCICCCARRRRGQPVVKQAGSSGDAARASEAGQAPLFETSAGNSGCDRGSAASEAAEEGTPLISREAADSDLMAASLAEAADSGMRGVAAVLVLLGMLLVMISFATMLVRGALRMQENFEAYRGGVQNMLRWLDGITMSLFGKLGIQTGAALTKVRSLYNYLLSKMQLGVEVLLDEIVETAYGGFKRLFVVFLYVLFWLLRPLPIGGQAGSLVRSYIWKKTFVSLLFGFWVSLLFYMLHVDLALFFGMVSFFLNYVPEVGSFISICVPVPVILLDGRLQSPVGTAVLAILGQLFLKTMFNNVLEMKLVEQDREMSIHPVWVLLSLNYFGMVWGATGMLISVPLLAMLKSALLSKISEPNASALTLSWAESLLNCLEGRPGRPRRKPNLFAPQPEERGGRTAEHCAAGGGEQRGSGGDEHREEPQRASRPPMFADEPLKPKKRQESPPRGVSSVQP